VHGEGRRVVVLLHGEIEHFLGECWSPRRARRRTRAS
jgi:hypothetical protein